MTCCVHDTMDVTKESIAYNLFSIVGGLGICV